MAKMLVVCPKCYTFFSADQGKRIMRCSECGGDLERVDRDYLWYSSLAPSDKESFKNQYVLEHYGANRSKTKHIPFHPMPQSGWVGYIGCCGWLALVLCIVGCIFSLLSGGLIYAVVLALVGALSCGSLILFSIVAEDVRHIRNQVDKLHHDQKYKQP